MVAMLQRVLVALLALAALPSLAAPEFNPFEARPVTEAPVSRLIVAMKPDNFSRVQIQSATSREEADAQQRSAAAARVGALGLRSGLQLQHAHSIAPDTHVVMLSPALGGDLLDTALAALRADSEVLYATPDRRAHAHAIPNDPLFVANPGPGQAGRTGQWYLNAIASTPAGIGSTTAATNAVAAWDTTTGSASLVIAVIDTGVLPNHPDLAGRLLPGFDFVGADDGSGANPPAGATFLTANDGNGWDSDPTDPGDWIDAADLAKPFFASCGPASPSSWHGTRVSGMLAAATNNGIGVAGITWSGKLLPVRALGKCGGFDSDIIAGMRWAAGLAVPGAPANSNKAQVINLSLGGVGVCGAAYQSAVTAVIAAGVTIVASAGNEGGPVDAPANCTGVLGITAVRHLGTKVAFGNVSGSIDGTAGTVALAAPGGNCVLSGAGDPCLFSLDTTTNTGTTVPVTTLSGYTYTNQTNFNIGTSFSSPIVAGIAGLMSSVNPQLTPDLLAIRLKASARAFPNVATDSAGNPLPLCRVAVSTTKVPDTSQQIECNCTTTTCGAGLADAARAVAEALRPIVHLTVSGSTTAGGSASFSASTSTAATGHTIASEAWSITSYSSFSAPSLSATTGTTSSLTVPSCGDVVVSLTITDDAGKTDTASTTVGQPPAAGTTCPGPSTGGGGGGALDGPTLATGALCAALLVTARRRRRAARTEYAARL